MSFPSRIARRLAPTFGRPRPVPGEHALRKGIVAAGGSLTPHRPAPAWQGWVNTALRTGDDVDLAVRIVRDAGLAPHEDRPKNWDALVALGTILERVPRRARILDMGAVAYSPLLKWLYQYGYRHLTAIDLAYREARHDGPIERLPMDLTTTTFPSASFGGIACLSVIEHGVDIRAFLAESARLLQPGGMLIVSTDFWSAPVETGGRTAYGVPVHIFDPAGIEALLAQATELGFELRHPVNLRTDQRVVHWAAVDLDYTFAVLVLQRTGGRGPVAALRQLLPARFR